MRLVYPERNISPPKWQRWLFLEVFPKWTRDFSIGHEDMSNVCGVWLISWYKKAYPSYFGSEFRWKCTGIWWTFTETIFGISELQRKWSHHFLYQAIPRAPVLSSRLTYRVGWRIFGTAGRPTGFCSPRPGKKSQVWIPASERMKKLAIDDNFCMIVLALSLNG